MMAAYTLPPFAPIARSCNSDQGLATQCLSVGAAMEHGDTLIVESLGLKIENRITPPGSEEAARIAAALRDLQWQRSALAQMSARSANEWLRIMTESRTEGQALQTWLTQVGVPLQPPSDWSPAPPN